MLRGRSPWGVRRGRIFAHLLVCLRSCSFVDVRGRQCFLWGSGAGSYIVEFDVPAYPGLYPSFLVFLPIPRPKGLRAFHKQLAATTNHTGSFTSSFGYLITGYPSISLPPSSLYKSFLLELVRFRTAWEPSTFSFTPILLFPPARA